jgi:phage gp36-like protein
MLAVKRPEERKGFDYDFRPDIGELGISQILSATSTELNGGTPLTVAGQSFQGGIARIEWADGIDGSNYLTSVVAEDTQAGVHEINGEIWVRAAGFAVPEIPANSYLTAAEYVDRFTVEETIRLTDETKSRVVDPVRLNAAITAEIEVVEAYLRQRYVLPLSSMPTLIRDIVADLARERLHRTRPLPAVTEAADRARKLLADIAAGRAQLALEGGEDPVQSGGSLAAWGPTLEGSVFNSVKLAGY